MKNAVKAIKKQVNKLRDKMETEELYGPLAYLDSILEEIEACEEELDECFEELED